MSSSSKGHLYWVSCNRCGVALVSKSNPPVKMYLASCGCLYCARCAQPSVTGPQGCHTCKAPSPKLLPVGKGLPQNVMEMFNKNEESLGKINKRSGFQNMHFERALNVLCDDRKYEEEMAKIDKELTVKEVKVKEMEKEIYERKAQVEKLTRAINNLKMNEPSRRQGSAQAEGVIASPPQVNKLP